VRVEVHDQSSQRPRMRRHSTEASTGRGLQLLESLSASWGVTPNPAGKAVWFELPLAGSSAFSAFSADDWLASVEPL